MSKLTQFIKDIFLIQGKERTHWFHEVHEEAVRDYMNNYQVDRETAEKAIEKRLEPKKK